jgi:hypothetical protein
MHERFSSILSFLNEIFYCFRKKLYNLKYFSLTCDINTNMYDELIVPFVYSLKERSILGYQAK